MPSVQKDTAGHRDARVIGVVGFAHGTSHFFHLLLPPLFPWLMHDFGLTFTEVGALMTIFFVISGFGQAAAGFAVDRFGPRRVLLFGVSSLAAAGFALAAAQHYWMLGLAAAFAGLGNSVFHPVDFTILNHRVSSARLGHAFSVHGLSGNLGWAAAPVFMAGIATFANWHWSGFAAGLLALTVLATLVWQRNLLDIDNGPSHAEPGAEREPVRAPFAFLQSPGVWLCFAFFFVTTLALGALQSFSPTALNRIYGLSLATATSCLTAYMLGGAGGMIVGGFLVGRHGAHERVITAALSVSALAALVIALAIFPPWSVMVLMAVVGFGVGVAGPSRDLLVRQTATAGFGKAAFGRIYGFVYSGLDIGFSLSPLVFGPLMDRGQFTAVLGGVALLQGMAILTALSVGVQSRVGSRAVSSAG
ncbi:MAG: MFS transporter [Betaproteobacteria bacterium]|nr:MFS transporter [Betaproteobacteria bacterium]